MRAGVAAAVLCGVLAAAGCGGTDPRERVDAYIRQANAVQERGKARFDAANRSYAAFAKGELTGEDAVPELEAAERAIIATRDGLAALRPPEDARTLHEKLLAAFDANAELAAESTVLARYLPAAADAVRPIARLNRRLRARLEGAQEPEVQGRALERYASGVDGVLGRMRGLLPAPVVRAAHQAQLARLQAVSRLARRLRRAVEARDRARTARLLLRFRRLNREDRAGSRLNAASIRAYNERYRALLRAQAAVQQERARLERVLAG